MVLGAHGSGRTKDRQADEETGERKQATKEDSSEADRSK
jgi:hypothetical protein